MIYDLPFEYGKEYINYSVSKPDFSIMANTAEKFDPEVGYMKFIYMQSAL